MGALKQRKVLVVDDEIEILDICHETLADRCQVVKTNSPFEALAFVKEARNLIDLIILDVQMPGMNGLDFLRELKTLGCRTPVILYSGFRIPDVMPSNVVRAFDKPTGIHRIRDEVDLILESRPPAAPPLKPTRIGGLHTCVDTCLLQLENLLRKHGCERPQNLNFTTAMGLFGNGEAYAIFFVWSSLKELRRKLERCRTEETGILERD